MALPRARVFWLTTLSACAVFGELRPSATAVCTANAVRSTCSRRSVSRPARSVAAAVAVVSPEAPLDDDDMPLIGDEDDMAEWDIAGCDDCCGAELLEPLDVHAVAARATAARAAPVVIRAERGGMDIPSERFEL